MADEHTLRNHAVVLWSIIKNPWCWPFDFLAAYSVSQLFPAVFLPPKARDPAMNAWLDGILSLPENPVFQIGFLITALACLWNGVRKVVKAAQSGEQTSKSILHEARNQVRPLQELAKTAVRRRAIEQIQDRLLHLEEARGKYIEVHTSLVNGGGATSLGRDPVDRLAGALENLRRHYELIAESLGPGTVMSFQTPQMRVREEGEPGSLHKTYILAADENRAYLDAHMANINAVRVQALDFNRAICEQLRSIQADEDRWLGVLAQ